MRNPIIESTIDEIINNSEYPIEFKESFKQFIKNKFSDNAKDSDLKNVLSFLEISEE